MKNLLLLLTVVFCICLGNLNAQNIPTYSYVSIQNRFIPINEPILPMPNWMDNWSNESVIAIKYLIKKYGDPNENSERRMVWNLAYPSNRTIIFTEIFSFKNSEENYNLPNACNLLKFPDTKETYTGMFIASDYKNNL
ncbi:MAG: hypothetical protein CVU03_02675 [Bacteroidetes bacterium HGW-Bacteroidetes-2]|jgi:hypothetical protein|nr:MAG: hypothetical protein CVU03_02675 [Bacteroidetes bacterium HGW-Bacteroidetes-2]